MSWGLPWIPGHLWVLGDIHGSWGMSMGPGGHPWLLGDIHGLKGCFGGTCRFWGRPWVLVASPDVPLLSPLPQWCCWTSPRHMGSWAGSPIPTEKG